MAELDRARQACMARLGRRIGQWRRAGRPGRRMPPALWEEASDLAEELGCYRVSRELGVSCGALRERT